MMKGVTIREMLNNAKALYDEGPEARRKEEERLDLECPKLVHEVTPFGIYAWGRNLYVTKPVQNNQG